MSKPEVGLSTAKLTENARGSDVTGGSPGGWSANGVETPRPHGDGDRRTDDQQNLAHLRELNLKRLAGGESPFASAPPPTSGRAPRGSPAAARPACLSA